MQALGICGWSGAGKTTLVAALIRVFAARGVSVSTVKHAHHNAALDMPGKDSFIHAEAGAREVILATDAGYALFSRAPAPLETLLARLSPVNLVLVEGYKFGDLPKLEVYRPALGKPPLWPETSIAAVAADAALPACPVPVLPLGAPEIVADFISALVRLEPGKR